MNHGIFSASGTTRRKLDRKLDHPLDTSDEKSYNFSVRQNPRFPGSFQVEPFEREMRWPNVRQQPYGIHTEGFIETGRY
jgi:hypothetical protein